VNLFEKIVNKKEKIAIIGLGYVGLPIAVSFSKKGTSIPSPPKSAFSILLCSEIIHP